MDVVKHARSELDKLKNEEAVKKIRRKKGDVGNNPKIKMTGLNMTWKRLSDDENSGGKTDGKRKGRRTVGR